mgnify:CR=1 FL=1
MSTSIPKPELIKALQTAVRTGHVVYGSKEVTKLILHGKARLVVIAANAPLDTKRDVMYYAKLSNIPVVIFDGTNIELGNVIGRPHSVAVLAVVDPGQSGLLEMVQRVESS